ncbi:MAG TPA: hypothetical protein VJG32_04535 [Anaerolineae bacterium]|nr:hypothetical protein [Anaerolineae bacterium]
MKRVLIVSLVVALGLILAACSGSASPAPVQPASASPNVASPDVGASGGEASSDADLTQTKEAAAVTVKVTPLNLGDASAATLDFQITLDTHSVDLGYDMTAITTLRSDAGEEVKPVKWDGPGGGGHHKEGVLSFPAIKVRGQALTLVLRGIADVAERTFEWNLDGSK